MNSRTLIRWSGVAAVAAGTIFAAIQPIHPPDVLASVTTGAWAIIQGCKLAMCLLFLVGLTGLYARQVQASGWLGLAGYLLFSLSWVILTPFIFVQALVNPLLASAAPAFVESFLGIINGTPGTMSLGALPALYALAGLLYALGGLTFGIATFRAGILPRRAAGLLAVGAVAPIVLSMLPHPLDRTLALPMGLAMAWLGAALWMEPRKQLAGSIPGSGGQPLRTSTAD